MSTQETAELQLTRDDHDGVLGAVTYGDGSVRFVGTGIDNRTDFPATLGQAIQMRDFLNRHIDSLALEATGSTAERASDDPTQLACTETLLQASLDAIAPPLLPSGQRVDAPAGTLHLVWNPGRSICVGFCDARDADYAETGLEKNPHVTIVGRALREGYELAPGARLPRTKVDFY